MKLPAGKYTVREREMLSGVAGAPESYFMPGNAFSNSIIVGAAPLPPTHAGNGTLLPRHQCAPRSVTCCGPQLFKPECSRLACTASSKWGLVRRVMASKDVPDEWLVGMMPDLVACIPEGE